MTNRYNSFKDIEKDLKMLNLQRQIALEELKASKYELQESLTPYQWVSTVANAVKKYGILYLINRLFRK